MTRPPTVAAMTRRLAALRPSAGAAWRSRAGRFADDLAGYVTAMFARTVTGQMLAVWDALRKPPYRVLVPSANAVGKTFLAACLVSHFYDHFDPSTTLCTAPTRVQVRDLLFKELRTLRPPHDFQPADTRLQSSWSHFVHGFTAATADSFQGRHAERLGIVFDEATGVKRPFWERAKTMHKGVPGHWWLCPYNPNDPSSPAAAEEDAGGWAVVRLSALDHPNIAAELAGMPPPVPAAVRLAGVCIRIRAECDEVAEADFDPATDFVFPPVASPDCPFPDFRAPRYWRPSTQAFEAQVLGRWPLLPAQSLFTPGLVAKCADPANAHLIDGDWLPQIGCDVARFGDDKTAIAVRRGPCLLHVETHAKQDTTWIADRIVELAHTFAPAGADVSRVPVYVDDTGGYGGGVVDQARGRVDVTGLSMSGRSPDPRHLRMRSHLWFRLRDIAAAGLLDLSRIDPGDLHELRADLCAPRFRHADGPKRVEPKDQIKQRLGRSPDVGDALTLCYYG